MSNQKSEKVQKSMAEWREELTPEQFHVMREQGTERAFTGPYWDNERDGLYRCLGCGTELFDSETKFDSGTGWPSFWAPADQASVILKEDLSHGRARVEVCCASCDAHLGHLFEDGPAPTGLRYCMNGTALAFEETE